MTEIVQYIAAAKSKADTTLNLDSLPKPTTDNVIPTIMTDVFVVMGIVAVLMMVIGGFRFIISNGDPSKVETARNTIIYAFVGLVILVLATTIVKFVTGRTV